MAIIIYVERLRFCLLIDGTNIHCISLNNRIRVLFDGCSIIMSLTNRVSILFDRYNICD